MGKDCKHRCEHSNTLNDLGVIAFSYNNAQARKRHYGKFKTCRICEKLYVGNSIDNMRMCFCCHFSLGVTARDNKIRKKVANLAKRI